MVVLKGWRGSLVPPPAFVSNRQDLTNREGCLARPLNLLREELRTELCRYDARAHCHQFLTTLGVLES
jgi:hypothetical protein